MSGQAPAVTLESLRACRMRQVDRAELPGGGSIVDQICVEHPRLGRQTYTGRPGVAPRVSYTVDGLRCTSLDAAIAALNGPVLPEDHFEHEQAVA